MVRQEEALREGAEAEEDLDEARPEVEVGRQAEVVLEEVEVLVAEEEAQVVVHLEGEALAAEAEADLIYNGHNGVLGFSNFHATRQGIPALSTTRWLVKFMCIIFCWTLNYIVLINGAHIRREPYEPSLLSAITASVWSQTRGQILHSRTPAALSRAQCQF